jgi:hypothetical protein
MGVKLGLSHSGRNVGCVFDSRMQRRIFELKEDEVIGEWKNLHHEELNYLYSSTYIIWLIKLRRMRWAEHVGSMGVRRGAVESKFI